MRILHRFRGLVAMIAALASMGLCMPAAAQRLDWEQQFGENYVRHTGALAWRFVSSEHFIIYYHDETNLALANHALHWAEKALVELRRDLDYTPGTKFQAHLFPSPAAFFSAPEDYDALPQNVTQTNQFSIYYPGSQAAFSAEIKSRLCRTLMADMLYGEGSSRAFQNRALLAMPNWFFDGLSRYLGEGWTAHDEMLLRSLGNHNPLPIMHNHPETDLARTLRKSVWLFLEARFTRAKVREIVYMVRLTRSVEGGLGAVVGFNINTLTSYWRDFASAYATGTHQNPRQGARQLNLLRRHERLVAGAASPNMRQVAVVVENGGLFQVRCADRRTGRTHETGIKWGQRLLHSGMEHVAAPLAFSPDGRRLVVGVHRLDGSVDLVYWEAETNAQKRVRLPAHVATVNHIAWSPDGKRLALELSRAGQTDVLVSNVLSDAFQPITNDVFDDLRPQWDPASQGLLFVSNRDTNLNPIARGVSYSFLKNNWEPYRVSVETRAIERVMSTPFGNEWQAFQFSKDSVFTLMDENGLLNLYQVVNGVADPLTDWQTGARLLSLSASGMLLAVPQGKQWQLLVRDTFPRQPLPALAPTEWGRRRQDAFIEALQARARAQADSINKLRARADSLNLAKRDSANLLEETRQRSLRYYVFDEQDETPEEERQHRRQTRRQRQDNGRPMAGQAFNVDLIRKGPTGRYRPTLQLNESAFRFGVDPVFRLWGQWDVAVSDPHRHHNLQGAFRVFRDLRSTDLTLQYRFAKHAIHFGAYYQRQTRRFTDWRVLQYRLNRAAVFAAFPLNQFSRLESGLEYTTIRREALLYTDQYKILTGTASILTPELRYIHDNVRWHGQFPLRGTRAVVALNTNYHIQQAVTAFSGLRADARKYTPLLGSLVLATRVVGGFSFGPRPQTTFIGGLGNWAISPNFSNLGDLPVATEVYDLAYSQIAGPIRGSNFNVRNGTKYAVLNIEVRVPLRRVFNSGLPSGQAYNWMWVLFYDLGTAWDQGNPFSQRNPINVDNITSPPFNITIQSLKSPFVQGLGTGLQGTLLGVLGRIDIAFPIEDNNVGTPRALVSVGHSF